MLQDLILELILSVVRPDVFLLSVLVDAFAFLVVLEIVLAQLLSTQILHSFYKGSASPLLVEALILINLVRIILSGINSPGMTLSEAVVLRQILINLFQITLSGINSPGMTLSGAVLLRQLFVIDDICLGNRNAGDFVTFALLLLSL